MDTFRVETRKIGGHEIVFEVERLPQATEWLDTRVSRLTHGELETLCWISWPDFSDFQKYAKSNGLENAIDKFRI